jgi:hypothetical protein
MGSIAIFPTIVLLCIVARIAEIVIKEVGEKFVSGYSLSVAIFGRASVTTRVRQVDVEYWALDVCAVSSNILPTAWTEPARWRGRSDAENCFPQFVQCCFVHSSYERATRRTDLVER